MLCRRSSVLGWCVSYVGLLELSFDCVELGFDDSYLVHDRVFDGSDAPGVFLSLWPGVVCQVDWGNPRVWEASGLDVVADVGQAFAVVVGHYV